MMKRAISVILFLISVKAVPGQSLSGTVTDTGDVPVPYASVIILSVPDSSFVSGTACDSAGRFDIAKSVTSGLLWVSSVGYRDRYLHFGSGTSGFGTVRLETEAGLIRNAAVTASMPLVQVRGNAMETIVEGSRLERAGTGEDLLSKIPGISVKDGKVSVFGGGSVTEVYINGRLVRNDTDLSRLESADVRSVELVRNPGARYKASAGSVIRIFTKKNKDEGFSLDNRAEIYNRFKWTASDQLGLSYRKGGMEITGSMFGRYMNHSDLRSYKNMDHGSVLFSSLTLAPSVGFWSPKLDVMVRKQWFIAGTPSGPENFGRPRLILNFDNSFRLPWNFRLDIGGSYISAGDDNNFRCGDCWQFDFSVYKGFLEDRLSIQLQGEDMFRTGRPEWRLYCDRYVQTVSEENRRTIRLTLRYKLNPSESKYRGTGAGRSQRYRM